MSALAGSPFRIRGVKGCFWDGPAKYLDIIPWLPKHRFNFLMVCYTSFPGSASDWRKPYTPEDELGLKEIARVCKANRVTPCLAINPGIWSKPPLRYAGEADYELIYSKLARVHALGFRWFALCLDDISVELTSEDKREFGALEAAQARLVNRLYGDLKKLDKRTRLLFCPSAYTTMDAKAHPEYIGAIGRNIHRNVMIFWTGPACVSAAISGKDADEFARMIRRKPFVWDNYPVNDYAGWRPLLGPIRNRSADLGGRVSGYLCNCMRQEEASKIPLYAIGDYLANPCDYDPEKSIAASIASYAGPDVGAIDALVGLYGRSFIGDGDFGTLHIPREESLLRALLARLRAADAALAARPSFSALYADVKDTLAADIRRVERRVRAAFGTPLCGPTEALTGMDFEGGGAEIFGYAKYGREETNYVYAKATGRDTITGRYVLASAPERDCRLIVEGLDDDESSLCHVEIRVNDSLAFSGPSGFENGRWAARSFDLPKGWLTQGANTITVRNTEESGALGMPPWFMISSVRIVEVQ